MQRVKVSLIAMLVVMGLSILWLGVGNPAGAVDEKKLQYPEPRFPASLKNPRTVDEVMPYARALARNKSNILGLGLGAMNPGDKILLVGDATSEDIYTDALIKALAERKVQATLMHDYEIAGVSKQDALEYMKTMRSGVTTEQGFREGCAWMAGFPGSQPWLKQNRPDLYDACFPKKTVDELPAKLKAIREKLSPGSGMGVRSPVDTLIIKYLEQHPEVRGVFYGRGGPVWYRFFPHQEKWLGVFTMDNRWDVVTSQASYPSDLWLLTEEETIEPLASVDKVHVTDPEGTDASWDMTEDQAQRWVRGVYLRGHLYMFPNEAFGQFGYSAVDYPAVHQDYIALEPIVLLNGTVAGTNGHGGFFPRMEEHWKDGYLVDVKGGGFYGDLLKTVLTKYPNVNSAMYPNFKHPGYFRHFETALGTNPKIIRHPLGSFGGTSPERMRAGVLHWALGSYYFHDPGPKYTGSTEWLKKFAADNKLPGEHGFHVHNYFATYQVHMRNTSKWITLVDKGRLSSLDSPQARSLASRYGDPDKITATEWIPEMPGINVPGQYEDYAKAPYTYSKGVIQKVEAGTYSYFYPSNKVASLNAGGAK